MFMKTLLIMPLISMMNIVFIKKSYIEMSLLWCFIMMISYMNLLLGFMKTNPFQINQNIDWMVYKYSNIFGGGMNFSVDGMSVFFMGLSVLLIPMCLMVSFYNMNKLLKEFYMLNFVVLELLMMIFSMMDMMGFYMIFETMLIPVFIIMGVWGSSEEKVKAAFYFFFYTLIGSLLMLLSIFKIYNLFGTTDYSFLVFLETPEYYQIWLFLGFSVSLLIKMPMMPTHMWLPQAHVEAPVAGSVLLAGVLLKLGGYGFISFSFILFPLAAEFFSPIFVTMSIIAIIYGAFCTCSQMDLKSLMAYSSMSHMGLVTLSIFCHSMEGLISSMLMMLAHGFVSSGLFICSSVIYTSFHSSLMKYFKGLAVSMPLFSILSFLLILGNISFPLTLNFIGELISIVSATKYSMLLGLVSCMGIFVGMVYSLYLFNRVYFGSPSPYITYPSDVTNFEFQGLIPLMFLTILLGVSPNTIIEWMMFSCYTNIST